MQDEDGKSKNFNDFQLIHLADVARAGQAVLDKLDGVESAKKAMASLFQRYLEEKEPSKWKGLFQGAKENAYQVKYMFREQVDRAQNKFRDNVEKCPLSAKDMYRR